MTGLIRCCMVYITISPSCWSKWIDISYVETSLYITFGLLNKITTNGLRNLKLLWEKHSSHSEVNRNFLSLYTSYPTQNFLNLLNLTISSQITLYPFDLRFGTGGKSKGTGMIVMTLRVDRDVSFFFFTLNLRYL